MRVDTAVFWTIWIVAIMGGVAIIIAAMFRRYKIIEMEHRERMSMIERGIVPGPSVSDPVSTVLGKGGLHHPYGPPLVLHDYPSVRRSRLLSGGIVTVGFGLALMTLLAVAADSFDIAVGVGGAVAILGLSFVVLALVQEDRSQRPPTSPPSPPGSAPMPPDRES